MTQLAGRLAIARCQYAWSLKTVAKFPMILITPKTRPLRERIVRYEPCALPGTGFASDAFSSNSCIFEIDPIFGEVAYTVKTKVKIMAKRTVVCVLIDNNRQSLSRLKKTAKIKKTKTY